MTKVSIALAIALTMFSANADWRINYAWHTNLSSHADRLSSGERPERGHGD